MKDYTKEHEKMVRLAYREAITRYPLACGRLLLAAAGSFARDQIILSSDID